MGFGRDCSGVVSSTLAFLLARQRQQAVFRSFGSFTFTLTAYGLVDGMVSWTSPDLSSAWFVGLGFVDLVLMGSLVWGLARLVAVGQILLVVLFLAVAYWGGSLILGWRRIHDRIFRRLLATTGVLFLVFVPLWLWDAFGRGGHYSFYWFLLFWNLGALTLAARAFFDPPVTRAVDTLFEADQLAACARRFGLTPREAEIAGLHAQGFSAKDIGATLFIAPKTVRNHISNLYQKTGTGQRRELLDLLRNSNSERL